jgi:DNA-binding Lrp family transcriptional regulator
MNLESLRFSHVVRTFHVKAPALWLLNRYTNRELLTKNRKFGQSQLSIMLKEKEKKLLIALLKNSKESDRKLAKKLGVSQPTVTRTRSKIEKEGIVKDYTIIPDWKKLGFEIMALTFTKMDPKVMSKELLGKVKKYASEFPNAFFASTGEGLGMTGVIMSLHRDYRDYARKLALFRIDWGPYMESIQSFVIVIGEGEIKEFSFRYLDENLL